MRLYREFRCPECNDKFERLVENTITTARCSCGGNAKKVVSAVRCVLDPISGHFPSATDKWAKHHEDAAKKRL